jgi:hypothetical protein
LTKLCMKMLNLIDFEGWVCQPQPGHKSTKGGQDLGVKG